MGSHKRQERGDKPPAFESKEAPVAGRDRGIGSSDNAETLPEPERDEGNPIAGGGFLSLADDNPAAETSLPASEADEFRGERRSP